MLQNKRKHLKVGRFGRDDPTDITSVRTKDLRFKLYDSINSQVMIVGS